jgi:hypothetical protein
MLECSISILHQLTRSTLPNTKKIFPFSLLFSKKRGIERYSSLGKGLYVLLVALLISACLPSTAVLPTPTLVTPTASATPTPTIVWFPPTATFTPFPTATSLPPTPDQRPGIGAVIFEDNFSDPTLWALSSNENGRAAFGKNELTIAIQEQKAYVFAQRTEPVLADFYAEITASPSLCQGADEYGLLIRLVSAATFYRFSLSCDGRVRLDRLTGGQASSPQPWLETGVVPIGAPSTSRLGVWVSASELRFFVDDQYLFTVQDPLIPSGVLGVFARSTGGHSFTVNYTDLIVYQLVP